MASSPQRQLPGAGLLPAGFIDEAGLEDKEWPTTGAVLAREIPEFGEGELSERRSGLPIFLEDAEIDLLLSEIAEVVLQNQDYCFTSYECWQDTPAEKIDSPRIHDPAGLAKINTASEASDYKQIMSTLEDLKKANEEELTEFCRMYLELRCRCLMLQYENEALKGHFAREINLKEEVHSSFCRPFTGLQDLSGIGKSLLDLSQLSK
ncbi:hypothetical protein HPP92_017936 [Vanilla planifolia]|uniref:Uncharacterized protein n=1 Tax=Vanilla planifolia TaxID=51239 RepID=A0A835Q4V1_VANPL|nr:hypothetical protein HPP92_017936 [Vanilla planifolia]